nr:bifunctional folylpolyglutamate synthase/dihydrofolate synthase [Eubacterium sp.]
LREAGYRTGLFTSPHLVSVLERFRISGEMITEEEFLEDFNEVEDAIRENAPDGGDHPTFFELLFLMAMLRFKKAGVDVAVLETGLGGRLDATNVIERPNLCIITSLSLEHTAYLGDTIEEIAAEKAGIIKEGVPVVCDATDPRAFGEVKERAQRLRAPLFTVKSDDCEILENSSAGIDFLYPKDYDRIHIHLDTAALYQVVNASLAARGAMILLGDREDADRIIERGLRGTRWPGRMEPVGDGIFFDGAHNPSGVAALLDSVDHRAPGVEKTLLFGALEEKDLSHMVESVCESGLFSNIILTTVDSDRACDAQKLKRIFEDNGERVAAVIDDSRAALEKALEIKGDGELYCAGSLYLLGELYSAYKTIQEG